MDEMRIRQTTKRAKLWTTWRVVAAQRRVSAPTPGPLHPRPNVTPSSFTGNGVKSLTRHPVTITRDEVTRSQTGRDTHDPKKEQYLG